jgi:tetratricopeptide (TPR) repeat protein
MLRRIIGPSRVDREPGAALELIHYCGSLPLALRIMAERIAAHPHRSLNDFVAELADERGRLSALDTGTDDDLTAIRSVFSWSYISLPPEVSRAFRLLGLHVSSTFGTLVAAALTGTSLPLARELLDALSRAHLVEEIGRDRYRMHDLLRLYAAERARADEPEEERSAATKRMLEWYLRTADAADRVLIPRSHHILAKAGIGSQQPSVFSGSEHALAWCEIERTNFVAAVQTAANIGDHITAWQLPAALWSFFTLRKHWTDWIATHETALRAVREFGDQDGEAATLNGLGVAHWELRRFDKALDCYNSALTVCKRSGDQRNEGRTLNNIGDVYWSLEQFDEAAGYYQRALVCRRETGDRWGEANTLHNMGDNYRDLREFDKALDHYRQALTAWRQCDDRWGEGSTLNNLGSTYRVLGRSTEALECYRRALALRRKTGDRWGEGDTLNCIGELLHDLGKLSAARERFEEALVILQELRAPGAAKVRASLELIP